MYSKKILVSVVIPTYNRTEYFKEAIESVQRQTYDNIEIIVVDDNARKPEVRDYVKEVTDKVSNCVLIQNENNKGGALTRNEGIKQSKGVLVAFLDDDDTFEATKIEKVVEMYSNHESENIGVIYTYCYQCDKEMNKVGEYRRKPGLNPLYKHMCNCLCATFQWTIPRIVFEKVGMFEQSPSKQDSILLLKILGNGYKAICVEEALSNFRSYDGERISRNVKNHIIGESNLLLWQRKFYNRLSEYEAKHAEVCTLRRIMYNKAQNREKVSALRILLKISKTEMHIIDFVRDIIFVLIGPNLLKKMYKKSIFNKETQYRIIE